MLHAFHFMKILPQTVEGDDRIIDGVPDDCQDGRNEGDIHFEPRYAEEDNDKKASNRSERMAPRAMLHSNRIVTYMIMTIDAMATAIDGVLRKFFSDYR